MKRLFLHWRKNLNHTTGTIIKQESIHKNDAIYKRKELRGGRLENKSEEKPASKTLHLLFHNHKFGDKDRAS